jgi:hypothetical protein
MRLRRHRSDEEASTASEVPRFIESLRPGEALDLVVNRGSSAPLDVRRVTLLDIDPQRGLVVSQPNRQIMKSVSTQRLEATILRSDHGPTTFTRWGFFTTIQAFIDDFQLLGSTQEALLLALPREIHSANLRAAFRVAIPPSLTPLLTLLDAQQQPIETAVHLLNLSAGGALLNYHQAYSAQPRFRDGDVLGLDMDVSDLLKVLAVRLYATQSDLARFRVRCRVIRTYQEAAMQYLGVAFVDLSRQQVDLLHAVLLTLQRVMAGRGFP